MSEPASPSSASVFAALTADIEGVCDPLLVRVTGTHALSLAAVQAPPPAPAGIGRWTILWPDTHNGGWCGQLRADGGRLPFGDDAFCTLLVRFVGGIGFAPERCAQEFARVLAPHGLLLVAEMHPRSLWRPWLDKRDVPVAAVPPQRWARSLRAAGLSVDPPRRCGALWPRKNGATGIPYWLAHRLGGAYIMQARKRNLAGTVLRKQPATRRAIEHAELVPGAHRLRA